LTFKFNMQKSGLIDTMTDLIVAFLGACLVAIWSYRYLTMDEDGVIKLIVRRFVRMNVMLQIKREERKRKRTAVKRTSRRKRVQDENTISDQSTGQP